jgi:hypothetical protein
VSGTGRWRIEASHGGEPMRMSTGAPAIAHSEWVRLFLGRAIAPAQLRERADAPVAAEYLVLGEAPDPSWPDARRAAAAAAASADVESLAAAVEAHTALMEAAARDGIASHPEAFVSSYSVLRCVTVSADPADWCVTDEGLSIVRWGLDAPGATTVLAWSPDEIRAMGARALMRLGLPQATAAAPDSAAAIAAAHRAIAAPERPSAPRPSPAPRRAPAEVAPEPAPERPRPAASASRPAPRPAPAPRSAAPRPAPVPAPRAAPAPVAAPARPAPAGGLPPWVLPAAAGLTLLLAIAAFAWAMSLRSMLRSSRENEAALNARLSERMDQTGRGARK